MSLGAPIRRTISSNLRLPRKTSRTASSAHFSPTISSVRATEHTLGWADVVTMLLIITGESENWTHSSRPGYGKSRFWTYWKDGT